MPAVKPQELAGIILKAGALGRSYASVSEIDINTFMATKAGLVAVDAVVVLQQ